MQDVKWVIEEGKKCEGCPLDAQSAEKPRHATLITAHAGAEGTQPNTLESINRLLSVDCDAMEVDVRRAGGALRLGHDGAESGPTLEQCFQLLCHGSDQLLNCDLKEDGLALDVLALAKEYRMERRVIFTGCTLAAQELEAVKACGAQAWLNTRYIRQGDFEKDIAIAREMGCEWLNLCFLELVEQTIPALTGSGLGISAWTADTDAEIRRLLGIGVGNITTRHPLMALKAREEMGR